MAIFRTNAVVVGRSNIVGKPMAQLLLQQSCTVTIGIREPVISKPSVPAPISWWPPSAAEMITADSKPGATVVDVGINRVPAPERGEGKYRLTGDVHFDSVVEVAGAYAGSRRGAMTIACLLRNTLVAAARRLT